MGRRFLILAVVLLLGASLGIGVASTGARVRAAPRDRLITLTFTGSAHAAAVDTDAEDRFYRSRLDIRSWRFVFKFKLSFLGAGKQNITAISQSVAGSTSYQYLKPDLTVGTCRGAVVQPTNVGSEYFLAVKKLANDRLRVFMQSGTSRVPVFWVAANPLECLGTTALPKVDFQKDQKAWERMIFPDGVLDWGAGKTLTFDKKWTRPLPKNQPQRKAQSFTWKGTLAAKSTFVD